MRRENQCNLRVNSKAPEVFGFFFLIERKKQLGL